MELAKTPVPFYVLTNSTEIFSQPVDNVYKFVYNSIIPKNTAFPVWITLWLKNSYFYILRQILCRIYNPGKFSAFSDNFESVRQ